MSFRLSFGGGGGLRTRDGDRGAGKSRRRGYRWWAGFAFGVAGKCLGERQGRVGCHMGEGEVGRLCRLRRLGGGQGGEGGEEEGGRFFHEERGIGWWVGGLRGDGGWVERTECGGLGGCG